MPDDIQKLIEEMERYVREYRPHTLLGLVKSRIDTILDALRAASNLPIGGDGQPLYLWREVWIVRSLAAFDEPGYKRGSPLSNREIITAHVASVGALGDPQRRASFIEPGSSMTIGGKLSAVFTTPESAEAALAALQSTDGGGEKGGT